MQSRASQKLVWTIGSPHIAVAGLHRSQPNVNLPLPDRTWRSLVDRGFFSSMSVSGCNMMQFCAAFACAATGVAAIPVPIGAVTLIRLTNIAQIRQVMAEAESSGEAGGVLWGS